jgi:hypothetical protein
MENISDHAREMVLVFGTRAAFIGAQDSRLAKALTPIALKCYFPPGLYLFTFIMTIHLSKRLSLPQTLLIERKIDLWNWDFPFDNSISVLVAAGEWSRFGFPGRSAKSTRVASPFSCLGPEWHNLGGYWSEENALGVSQCYDCRILYTLLRMLVHIIK